MSDTVTITVVALGGVVVLVLILVRRLGPALKRFGFNLSLKDGFKTEFETHIPESRETAVGETGGAADRPARLGVTSIPQLAAPPPQPVEIPDGSTTISWRIAVGEYQEFIWDKACTVRIEVMDIQKKEFHFDRLMGSKEAYGADLKVSVGGGIVYGGYDCQKLDVNRFLVPHNLMDDEVASSVFAFHARKHYFDFFKISVEHVNPHFHQVTLNLFFCRSREIRIAQQGDQRERQ